MGIMWDFYSGKGKFKNNKENDMSEEKGYDRNLDKVLHKELVKSENKFLNVEVFSYNGGTIKMRIKPVEKNTNPQADPNKKWINKSAISGLTKQEALDLAIALKKAADTMK